MDQAYLVVGHWLVSARVCIGLMHAEKSPSYQWPVEFMLQCIVQENIGIASLTTQ